MSIPNKDLLDLYDQAAAKARSGIPMGWGINVRVKIADREMETQQIPPPAVKSYPAKAVKIEDLKKALRGKEDMVEIKEQGDEIIVSPLHHLGKDWGTIDTAIKELNGGARAWKSDPDPLKSKWVMKKG